jgi:hypothetical protein
MRTALYYPHTEVQSIDLVKTALLTWDRLEYIAPFEGYIGNYGDDRDMAEAMNIIGHAKIPSDAHKKKVHNYVEELIENGIPKVFRYPIHSKNSAEYEMWPQKLLYGTWELLRKNKVIGPLLSNADYPTSRAAGMTIMSILADAMAGTTKTRITDQSAAYAALANAPAKDSFDERSTDLREVVALTYKAIAIDQISLDKLIELRKREAKSSGHHYRAQRHLYLDALEAHLIDIAKYSPDSEDRREVDRIFVQKMEDDLRDLKEELGFSRRDTWLSRDTLTLALASAASATSAVATAAFGIPLAIPTALSSVTNISLSIGGVLASNNRLAT